MYMHYVQKQIVCREKECYNGCHAYEEMEVRVYVYAGVYLNKGVKYFMNTAAKFYFISCYKDIS